MTFEDVYESVSLISRRNDLESLLAAAKGPNIARLTIGDLSMILEPHEACTFIQLRIVEIDQRLAEFCVYPTPKGVAENGR